MPPKRQSIFDLHREMFALSDVADDLATQGKMRLVNRPRLREPITVPPRGRIRPPQVDPPLGHTVVKTYRDDATGFSAVALRHDGSGRIVFAIAQATIRLKEPFESLDDGPDALRAGEKQFLSEAAQEMIDDATAHLRDTGDVVFTGHSLGGTLAQRAAYEVGRRSIGLGGREGGKAKGRVSGVTFAAVGGSVAEDGRINDMKIDPNVAATVPITNYFFRNDFAPRLGDGRHLGDLMVISDSDLDQETRSSNIRLHFRRSYEEALSKNADLFKDAEPHRTVPPRTIQRPDDPNLTPTLAGRRDTSSPPLARRGRTDERPRPRPASRTAAARPGARATEKTTPPITPGRELDAIRRATNAEMAVRALQRGLNAIVPHGVTDLEEPLNVDGKLGPKTERRFSQVLGRLGPERLGEAIRREGQRLFAEDPFLKHVRL